MRKPMFLFQGNGNLLNRGCEAIFRSTVAILREEFGNCRFVDCSGTKTFKVRTYDELDPDVLHVGFPDRWTPRWFYKQYERRILHRVPEVFRRFVPKALAVLALGGDNYTLDYSPQPVNRFLGNRVVLDHNKPLVLWGASIGPFTKNPEFEKYAAEELKKVTLICARESETIAYLDSIGVRENVRAVSDPAFLLEPKRVELSGREKILLEEKCIGVNLSPLLRRYWEGEQPWKSQAIECVRMLLEEFDLPIILISHVVYGKSNDYTFMSHIFKALPEFQDRFILLGNNYNCQELKWIISKLLLFAGARTHSTIASLSSCVPTISIGYSMKARGINKDIFGHLDCLLPLESLEPRTLTSAIGNLMDKRFEVQQYLREKMPNYNERARLGAKYLREVLS
jgi:polysaccharide pyruvyl transferase WcaK-like protein